MQGYVKLWRKFTETSFFKNSHCVHLAIYLLMDCNHEPKKFIFNGKEETCNRGQTVTGLNKMSFATGISIRSLRTSLDILANVGFLTSKTTNKFRVITIGKYNDYQDKPTSNLTIKRQSNDNQTTTNKNDKNDKNDKNKELYIEFLRFWDSYPKKTGKGNAWEAWKKVSPSIDKCLATLKWQTVCDQWTKDDGKFIPMPTTWLNGHRWEDEPVHTKTSGAEPIAGKYDKLKTIVVGGENGN